MLLPDSKWVKEKKIRMKRSYKEKCETCQYKVNEIRAMLVAFIAACIERNLLDDFELSYLLEIAEKNNPNTSSKSFEVGS